MHLQCQLFLSLKIDISHKSDESHVISKSKYGHEMPQSHSADQTRAL